MCPYEANANKKVFSQSQNTNKALKNSTLKTNIS